MDFGTAPFIVDAIRKRCECEVLGYTGNLTVTIGQSLIG